MSQQLMSLQLLYSAGSVVTVFLAITVIQRYNAWQRFSFEKFQRRSAARREVRDFFCNAALLNRGNGISAADDG
jgi:hypothetical protein